jgi:hypothetical protein
MRFMHIYTMRPDPSAIAEVAPRHAAYWHDLDLPGYRGGPFGDRSGGLITFDAEAEEDARELIAADPFVREDLLESSLLKRWLAE